MRIERAIDRESKISLYVQAYSIFKDKITTGEWPISTQIPSEDELCDTYNVSKITVREAIYELVREGYLKRQQGKGTFVTLSLPHHGLVVRTRMAENVCIEGIAVKKEIVESGKKETPWDIKNFLATEDRIYYVLCKNTAGAETYIEELFIPLLLIPGIEHEDLTRNSIYDLIEDKATKKIFKVLQTIEAISIKSDAALILNKKEGTPALAIRRSFSAADGSHIGYMRFICSGSKFKFQMEFERIK